LVRVLNQVGFSPAARRSEIERQAAGDPELETALAKLRDRIAAGIAARQRYLPTRKWSLNTQLQDIAMAARKRWQHYGEPE